MSEFLFERVLIIQIDGNKDGIFDFGEMVAFLVGTNRAPSVKAAQDSVVIFFSSHQQDPNKRCKQVQKNPSLWQCPPGVYEEMVSNGHLTWLEYATNIGFFKDLSPKDQIKENAEKLYAIANGSPATELE